MFAPQFAGLSAPPKVDRSEMICFCSRDANFFLQQGVWVGYLNDEHKAFPGCESFFAMRERQADDEQASKSSGNKLGSTKFVPTVVTSKVKEKDQTRPDKLCGKCGGPHCLRLRELNPRRSVWTFMFTDPATNEKLFCILSDGRAYHRFWMQNGEYCSSMMFFGPRSKTSPTAQYGRLSISGRSATTDFRKDCQPKIVEECGNGRRRGLSDVQRSFDKSKLDLAREQTIIGHKRSAEVDLEGIQKVARGSHASPDLTIHNCLVSAHPININNLSPATANPLSAFESRGKIPSSANAPKNSSENSAVHTINPSGEQGSPSCPVSLEIDDSLRAKERLEIGEMMQPNHAIPLKSTEFSSSVADFDLYKTPTPRPQSATTTTINESDNTVRTPSLTDRVNETFGTIVELTIVSSPVLKSSVFLEPWDTVGSFMDKVSCFTMSRRQRAVQIEFQFDELVVINRKASAVIPFADLRAQRAKLAGKQVEAKVYVE